jgi:hypothetical protein
MGLAEGGITFKSYYVDGDPPEGFRPDYLERITLHRFRPLTVENEEDLVYGWVQQRNLLDTSFQFNDVFAEDYLVLALRIDRWAVPPALLKAQVRKAESDRKREQGREHLGRLERGEILDRERLALKKQSLPAVRAIDWCWHLTGGMVRFSSLSRSANELFSDLFERTFGLHLIPDNPYLSALHVGLPDDLISALADAEPGRD